MRQPKDYILKDRTLERCKLYLTCVVEEEGKSIFIETTNIVELRATNARALARRLMRMADWLEDNPAIKRKAKKP